MGGPLRKTQQGGRLISQSGGKEEVQVQGQTDLLRSLLPSDEPKEINTLCS